MGVVRTSFQVDELRQSKAESDVKVEMKYCSSLKMHWEREVKNG